MLRQRIINYCQERYKFFGTGILNTLYFQIIFILNRVNLGGETQ